MKVKCDHRSKFSNLSNWKEEAWKKSGLQRDSNPWPPRYRWSPDFFQASSFQLLKLENLLRWSHFTFISYRRNYFIYISHKFTAREEMNSIKPCSQWLHSSVGRASHRYRGGHGFESRWSPDFFQASSFQLLKLENLLRWSHFTFKLIIVSFSKIHRKNEMTIESSRHRYVSSVKLWM